MQCITKTQDYIIGSCTLAFRQAWDKMREST